MYKTTIWKQRRRKEIREKVERTLIRTIFVMMFLIGVYGCYHGIRDQFEHAQAAPRQTIIQYENEETP